MDNPPGGSSEQILSEADTPITPAANAKKVLCIEDEHFIGELYARALAKAGFDIKVISDGRQGFEAAQTDQYDIILLDLMIPNMTGIEILEALRNPERNPQLRAKIIVTTNLEQREEVRERIERQADGYLVKAEITPHELVEFLTSIA